MSLAAWRLALWSSISPFGYISSFSKYGTGRQGTVAARFRAAKTPPQAVDFGD
jgi:hypothetical protein